MKIYLGIVMYWGTKTIFFKRIENYLPVHKSKSVHILSIQFFRKMQHVRYKIQR